MGRPAIRTMLLRRSSLLLLGLALAACGRGGDGGGAGGASGATAVPARAGEVWEADHPEDRATAPAALVAFVNGLHVVVLDGDDAYAGMTRLHATPGTDGKRAIPLANGLAVELAPVGDALQLRFSSGESLALRRQPPRAGE